MRILFQAVPFPLVFAALFLAMWLLISLVVSRVAGWTVLASSFLLEADFTGVEWGWQSARMRWGVAYNNVLKVGCDERGLYLAMPLIFRVGHPPLLIPWNQITVSRKRFFLLEYVQLTLGREERIPLLLRPSTTERLHAAAGEHWPGGVN